MVLSFISILMFSCLLLLCCSISKPCVRLFLRCSSHLSLNFVSSSGTKQFYLLELKLYTTDRLINFHFVIRWIVNFVIPHQLQTRYYVYDMISLDKSYILRKFDLLLALPRYVHIMDRLSLSEIVYCSRRGVRARLTIFWFSWASLQHCFFWDWLKSGTGEHLLYTIRL